MSQDTRIRTLEGRAENFVLKRRLQLIFFISRNILLGAQDSIILPSAWQYLKRLSVAKWTYGAVIAAYPLSASVLAPVLGAVYDKTKRTREILDTASAFLILGSLLYSLPYSPWLLFFGRLLSGIGYATEPVISAEISLSTHSTERIGHLSFVHLGFVLGLTLGPPLTFGFQNLKINIGEWPIDYTNAPGLFMGLVWIVLLLPQRLMIHNIVLRYKITGIEDDEDMPLTNQRTKSKKISSSINPQSFVAEENNSNTQSRISNLCRFWKSSLADAKEVLNQLHCLEVYATLFSAFWTVVLVNAASVLMPLVLQEDFHWSVLNTNVAFLGGGLLAASAAALFGVFGKYIEETTCIVVLNCIGIVLCLLLVIYTFCDGYEAGVAIFFTYLVILGIFCLLTYPCTTSVMANITPPDTQGSILSVTNVIFTAGSAFGSLWGSLLYKYTLSLNITTMCFFVICNAVFVLSIPRIREKRARYNSAAA